MTSDFTRCHAAPCDDEALAWAVAMQKLVTLALSLTAEQIAEAERESDDE